MIRGTTVGKGALFVGCVPCIVSDKDAFSRTLTDPQAEKRQWAEYLTPAEYIIPPVGARQSCGDDDVNLKTKGRKKEAKGEIE